MNFGSLFSGIGGLDLGLERAGMTCKWQVEIDDFCQKVLDKHWPEVRKYRDVREVGIANLEPVDLIAGGFPCQPHSVAGKRRGKDDDRNLWPEYLRIIREVRPTWVVGENVPGIITTMLDDVLADLEGAGYTPTVFNIPAAAFGANHIRYRIIVVAHSISVGWTEGSSSAIRHEKQEPERQEPEYICEGISTTADVADTNNPVLPTEINKWEEYKQNNGNEIRNVFTTGGQNMANSNNTGMERCEDTGKISGSRENREKYFERFDTLGNNWSVEPNVGRVAYGVPNRVDRLKSLGNAVVPQVAEYIGRCILETEQEVK